MLDIDSCLPLSGRKCHGTRVTSTSYVYPAGFSSNSEKARDSGFGAAADLGTWLHMGRKGALVKEHAFACLMLNEWHRLSENLDLQAHQVPRSSGYAPHRVLGMRTQLP